MTISPHFFHISSSAEQKLMQDLTRETIQLKGLDLKYIPRDSSDADFLFGEDVQSTFSSAVVLEMYCEEQTGFGGEGDFLSNFGLDIRDEAKFIIDKVRFTEEVTDVYPAIKRPREGDLIFYDLANSLFEITFVENERPFYQRGIQTVWDCSAKKVEYNHDILSSGDIKVDALEDKVDTLDDGNDIQTEGDEFIDFSEADPFSDNDY